MLLWMIKMCLLCACMPVLGKKKKKNLTWEYLECTSTWKKKKQGIDEWFKILKFSEPWKQISHEWAEYCRYRRCIFFCHFWHCTIVDTEDVFSSVIIDIALITYMSPICDVRNTIQTNEGCTYSFSNSILKGVQSWLPLHRIFISLRSGLLSWFTDHSLKSCKKARIRWQSSKQTWNKRRQ